ncbi:MAG: hypothetical protein PHD25_08860 [Bacteroidales bacterium]|nr:hypothetical protein [Bacteroidales bacterium]
MKKPVIKYSCGIILLLYIIAFAAFKHPRQEWDRVINSDGKAYYAYLTAIFIYHDLQFNFVESYESSYYPADRSAYKEFRVRIDDRIVNKAYPGLAVLWLPFFLLAHLITLLAGFSSDGYSIVYQYAMGLSALFYLWLGCTFLKKLLMLLGTPERRAILITLVTAFGTNLIYYTVNESTMTHTYSFALVAAWIFFVIRTFRNGQLSWLPLIALLTGLIIIIRPLNALVLLTVPFWAGGWGNVKSFLYSLKTNRMNGMTSLLIFILILAIPIVLWYLQTGKPLVYSYGDEFFNFSRPRIAKILFSYEKGWFLYTPAALISFIGFVPLLRKRIPGSLFLLVFWIVFIYMSSCWWIWNYTSRFSQRIFIDFLAINAVMLATLFQPMPVRGPGCWLLATLLCLLILLNIFQYYQCWKWIYPIGPVTRETYWKHFFSVRPMASAEYPPEARLLRVSTFCHGMESDAGWINPGSSTGDLAHTGVFSAGSGGRDTISTGIDKLVKPLLEGKHAETIISAWVCSQSRHPGVTLVVDYLSSGLSFFYQSFPLDPYLRKNTWTFVRFKAVVPRLQTDLDHVKVYFMNHSPERTAFIDDVCIELISLRTSSEPVPTVVNLHGDKISVLYTLIHDMETDSLGTNPHTLTDDLAMTGRSSSRIDASNPYSAGFRGPPPAGMDLLHPEIQVSAYVLTDADTSRAVLVADFRDRGRSFYYSPFALGPSLRKDRWIFVENLITMPPVLKADDEVLIYFWNPSKCEVVHLDDLRIDFLSVKETRSMSTDVIDPRMILSDTALLHEMEYPIGWKNEVTLSDALALYGRRSCRISADNPYSVALQGPLTGFMKGDGKIRIGAYVHSNARNSSTTLAVDFRRNEKSYRYVPYYMNMRSRFMEWEYVEFVTPVPDDRLPGDEVFIYFWNASPDEVFFIDNMNVEFITLADQTE